MSSHDSATNSKLHFTPISISFCSIIVAGFVKNNLSGSKFCENSYRRISEFVVGFGDHVRDSKQLISIKNAEQLCIFIALFLQFHVLVEQHMCLAD